MNANHTRVSPSTPAAACVPRTGLAAACATPAHRRHGLAASRVSPSFLLQQRRLLQTPHVASPVALLPLLLLPGSGGPGGCVRCAFSFFFLLSVRVCVCVCVRACDGFVLRVSCCSPDRSFTSPYVWVVVQSGGNPRRGAPGFWLLFQ